MRFRKGDAWKVTANKRKVKTRTVKCDKEFIFGNSNLKLLEVNSIDKAPNAFSVINAYNRNIVHPHVSPACFYIQVSNLVLEGTEKAPHI